MEHFQNTEKENEIMSHEVEMTCMTLMGCALIASMFISPVWIKVVIAGVCAVIISIPIVVKMMRKRNRIDLEKAIDILKKKGFQPVFKDDGIRWMVNGKECILRIHSQYQVEISREYDIQSTEPVIVVNERAARETMKEVYLAKVAVKTQGESSLLAFSTESLCTSSQEFMAYLPMCLDILDLAEFRQQVHIKEVHEGVNNGARKKIGFEHQDGSIR